MASIVFAEALEQAMFGVGDAEVAPVDELITPRPSEPTSPGVVVGHGALETIVAVVKTVHARFVQCAVFRLPLVASR